MTVSYLHSNSKTPRGVTQLYVKGSLAIARERAIFTRGLQPHQNRYTTVKKRFQPITAVEIL